MVTNGDINVNTALVFSGAGIMEFDGFNGGRIELLDDVVVIQRYGMASRLNHGLKGEKRIPYSSLTSIQFKDAGWTTGYIQFGVRGGSESRGGVMDAVKDENTVLFTKKAQADFERLRSIVESRMSSAGAPVAAAPASLADELSKLAALRDQGILSDDEFTTMKARLLSG